ncbi:MAG: hypothetical protein R3250_04605 [Melioribacteraceae bacterium]|nr:hypothetical protein [Melioribacteraceae bacterium]
MVTKTEIRGYVPIDNQLQENRLQPLILRAQRENLRDLLGDALYYDLFDNVTDINNIASPYDDLVNGVAYEYDGDAIQYYGLKPFISFQVATYLLEENDLFIGNTGNHAYNSDPQDLRERMSGSQKRLIVSNYQSSSVQYQNDIIKFLNEKDSDYPLWEGDSQKPITQYSSIII